MEELTDSFLNLHLEKKSTKKKLIKEVECKFVLEPCNILNQIDIEILKDYVKKDIDANREYFDDKKITYKISDPKKAEWILHKSIENSELVGDGNTNIDVFIKKSNIGIDVSILSLTKNMTNEKSIIQNFTTGNELDSLFLNNNGMEVVEIFRNKMLEKYKTNETNNLHINELYYMIFVCVKQNIYLTCFKANCKNISNIEFNGFTPKCKSAMISNFVNDKYGETKLYKSKKRIELRLNKNIINETCSIKLY
jgi:hypothetical protein